MKKLLAIALILVLVVLSGLFIYSYSVFNEEKNEAFNSAIKVCERNIEFADTIEEVMQQLERYAVSKNSDDINPYYVEGLNAIKSDIMESYETDCKYLYDLLKDYVYITETGSKVALESYVTAEDCLFKAYVTLVHLNDADDYMEKYNGFIKDAKKELDFGKSYFESYIDKSKNLSFLENLKIFIKSR